MQANSIEQHGDSVPQFVYDDFEYLEPTGLWESIWGWLVAGPLSLVYIVLLIAMIVFCIRNDPNWFFWMWIMLVAQPIGAIVYFVVRFLPTRQFEDWSLFKRWKKVQALPRLQGAAAQIGNPHQYVLLGDALLDLKRTREALDAYSKAIQKEPQNLQALWGAARCRMTLNDPGSARPLLVKILEQDPNFKFGDVSLAFARVLNELKETTAARVHLQSHVKKWRQPEAFYLLASILADDGETEQAKQVLQEMFSDLQLTPASIARKSIFWKSRAVRLRRKLNRATISKS